METQWQQPRESESDVSINDGVESAIHVRGIGTIKRSGTAAQTDSYTVVEQSDGSELVGTSANCADVTSNLFSLDYRSVIWDRVRHPGLPEIVLAGYRRSSTPNQRTGHRYLESAEDVVRWGLLQGPEYGVILFDERTRSGSSIAGRKQLPVLLGYLRAGAVQGIVAEDIKRLTRDQTGIDGLEIAHVLREGRGILVTRKRRYDLRNIRDFEDFQENVLAAGDERREIRDILYEGQEDRAKRVLRGLAAPMFRRWPVVGYRWAIVFAKPPEVVSADDLQCERAWTLIDNGHPMVSRCGIQKTYTKCHVCGPWVEAVRRELNAGHMNLSGLRQH